MAECVGCGYCCQKAQCVLSVATHGRQPVCPELVQKHGRYWCGLVLRALEQVNALVDAAPLIESLAIGAGCSSSLFNTQREQQLARMRKG